MSRPKRHPLSVLTEFSIPLIGGVIAALLWANLGPESYAAFLHYSPFGEHSDLTFHFLFNDIFMVFFFGIAAGEITEACLPGGALNPPRRAVNPILATVGGVVGPVAVYLIWAQATGDASIVNGWGVPTATDIALAWLVARMVFGKGHPAVSFLLLLAVADDGIGLGIIAVKYPDPLHPTEPVYLALVAVAMVAAFAMRRFGIKHFAWFVLGPGVLSWLGLLLAHLHPALALVAIVPFMPHAEKDFGLFAEEEEEGPGAADTLNRFQAFFRTPVDFGLFGFGIANAGVMVSNVGNATWAVLVALIVGKTLGVFLFGAIGQLLGFPLPAGMGRGHLLVTGMIAGLGLTVALFVAGQAFVDPTLQGAAKMGALLSVLAAPLAFATGRLLRVRRPVRSHAHPRGADTDAVAT
ncbi:MAG TPA: Na+/H+ antiporter NhaA [Kofleriaceae bacterium]|nr:Na+/H+ antiporter NhaA [Kofleriaceae bacterium]